MRRSISKIRVIRTSRGWVKSYEYSQGISSYTYTYKLLDALNVPVENSFVEQCIFNNPEKELDPKIETYKITVDHIA